MSKILEEQKAYDHKVENWAFQIERVKERPSDIKMIVKRLLIEGENDYEKLLQEYARREHRCKWCGGETP